MSASRPLVVVGLGGNAISPSSAEGNIDEQFSTSRSTAARLVDLIEAGWRVVITHGNGPQVGNILRRVELAAHEVYRLPLHICVADTQAGMGYMIGVCLNNELRARGIRRQAVTLVTCVEVRADDPAMQAPSKPIGRYYSAEQAAEMQARFGWRMVAQRSGHRRVVASPAPVHILEIDAIRRLLPAGDPLIVGGGGGIPVVRHPDGSLHGVEAVVDKDRTSALLADELDADHLVIATEVRRVALDFGRPKQRDLDHLTVDECDTHLAAGQFPPGSMGPKITAASAFVRGKAGRSAVICHLDDLRDALDGAAGTRIVAAR